MSHGYAAGNILSEQVIRTIAGDLSIKDRDLTAPPGSPSDGDTYIPAATATGDWAGQEDNVTYWDDDAQEWVFITADEGQHGWVEDENIMLLYDGASWGQMPAGDAATLDGIDSTGFLILAGQAGGQTIAKSIQFPIETITGADTLDDTNMFVLVNNSANITVTLPTAVGITGRVYYIKKISASGGTRKVTVDGNGAETLDGATTIVLNSQYSSISIISDGANWSLF